MSENVDLYNILGVSKTSSMEDLKKSYKKLCIKHHPDKGGDENEFKKISEAYNILKDPEKREIYDKHGVDGLRNGMAQNVDVQSMMENLFGFGFGGRQSQNRPPPVKMIPLSIPLEDVVNGNQNYVYKYERKIIDRTKERKECRLCQGQGFRVMSKQVGFMQMQQQVECPQCKGARFENIDQLFQTTQESVSIPIPKNCGEHHKFVLRNQQDERLDGESGDVILVIEYCPHPIFKRCEDDLFIELKLSLIESLCGFEQMIDLLDQTKLRVVYPYMLKWNEMLVIPNKGLWNPQKQSYGNLNIVYRIDYPEPAILTPDRLKEISENRMFQNSTCKIEPQNLMTKIVKQFDQTPTSSKSSDKNGCSSNPSGSRVPVGIPGFPHGMPFQNPNGQMPGGMECHQQ